MCAELAEKSVSSVTKESIIDASYVVHIIYRSIVAYVYDVRIP